MLEKVHVGFPVLVSENKYEWIKYPFVQEFGLAQEPGPPRSLCIFPVKIAVGLQCFVALEKGIGNKKAFYYPALVLNRQFFRQQCTQGMANQEITVARVFGQVQLSFQERQKISHIVIKTRFMRASKSDDIK